MANKPISYLVSSYNKAPWLPSVLASVAWEHAATGGEIIVIDDGSTDGSADICVQFATSNTSVHLIRQANRGIFAVTNQLLSLAGQPWIRLVDSDDPLIPGSTRALVDAAEAEGYDYIFGRMTPYGPKPRCLEAIRASPCPSDLAPFLRQVPDPYRYAIREYWHIPSTTVFRASLLRHCELLPENFISCQDLALALRLFATARVAWVDTPVCHQLVGVPNRLSAKEWLTLQQTASILAEFGERRFSALHKNMARRKLLARAARRAPRRSRLRLAIMALRVLSPFLRPSLTATARLFPSGSES